MNKKLKPLISIALIIIISIPVFSIVFARKPDKGPLEKIVYIHYKKGHAKPPDTPGVGPDKDKNGEEGHYTFLAKGVKWKEENLPIEYVINPTNSDGLLEDFVTGAISISAGEWDNGTYTNDDNVWAGVNVNLFADGHTLNYTADWDSDKPDGDNEISFGDYPQDGVIAVCIVWGRFGGPPGQREIVEFDIMFDTNFTWGNVTESPGVMDLQNIVTHELGHGLGLGDLYRADTTEETMYGFSGYGDIEKRDLYLGDIAGIQELYGE